MNDSLRDVVTKPDTSMEEIRDVAIKEAGMTPLFEAAKKYVFSGDTSYSELLGMIVSVEREKKGS